MTLFTLECYLVSVLDRDNQDLTLSDFSDSLDLYDVFIRYLEERDLNFLDDRDKYKMFRVTKYHEETYSVRGIIEVGDYGFSAELIDTVSAQKTYDRSPTEAEMMPYYFLAYLPRDLNRGIVILQKTSGRGIQTSLFTDFKKHAREFNRTVKVDFRPFVPRSFIEEMTRNARWTKIRFIRYNLPQSIQEDYRREALGKPNQIEGVSEFVIQPTKNQNLPAKVLDWAKRTLRDTSKGDTSTAKGMTEIIGHDYDNVKMEIELGGRRKTVNLERIDALKTDYDITKTVQVDEGGHPRFNSIDSAAKDLLDSVLTELENEES